jgi:hypothetical protein
MEQERKRWRRAGWQPDLFQPHPPVAEPSTTARAKLLELLAGLLSDIALIVAVVSHEEGRHEQDHR